MLRLPTFAKASVGEGVKLDQDLLFLVPGQTLLKQQSWKTNVTMKCPLIDGFHFNFISFPFQLLFDPF